MLLAVEVAFVITVHRKHSVTFTFSQMLSCCNMAVLQQTLRVEELQNKVFSAVCFLLLLNKGTSVA